MFRDPSGEDNFRKLLRFKLEKLEQELVEAYLQAGLQPSETCDLNRQVPLERQEVLDVFPAHDEYGPTEGSLLMPSCDLPMSSYLSKDSNFQEMRIEMDILPQGSISAESYEKLNHVKMPSVIAREEADWAIANTELPIVQFSSPMYYCSLDDETFITLDVIRIGNLASKSEISYRTKSGTAKAGQKFVESSGRITFEEGSNNEELQIDLLKSNNFDTTTEFQVELIQDPMPTNCQTGRYLYLARVKVIDGNCFPSNKYAELIQAKDINNIPFWGLIMEYVKFNMQSPVTRRGTIKIVLVAFFRSSYMLLKLMCNLYLVDKILTEKPEKAWIPLTFLALLATSPMAVLHFLDYRSTTWKVSGSSRAKLQSFLMRKFLNYSQSVRINLNSAEIVLAITQDVSDLVTEGYLKFLDLLASLMNLFAVLVFQVLVPLLPMFKSEIKPLGFLVLVFIPSVLLTILFGRHHLTTKYTSQKNQDQVDLVAQAERTMANYPLIADFGQRPFFEARFEKRVQAYNASYVKAEQVTLNNHYFSPWLTTLCILMYTIHGGLEVVTDGESLSLGFFLANLSIISYIGESVGLIYSLLMEIETTAPSLYKITRLINLPTDVPVRKALNRDRRAKTFKLRKLLGKSLTQGWPADNLPIEMTELRFTYDSTREPVFALEGTARFYQGELTALVGPQGSGKSTLLYMLGGVVLPEPGQVFVPSHLRVLHVATQILFFKASLFENLTFGCLGADDEDGRLSRVLAICQRLGFPKEITELIKQGRDGPVLPWADVMSQSHKSLLHFARAMIINPELMCIHKPVMTYTDTVSGVVLGLLREFCEQKGIEQDGRTRHLRRPRTCIITAAKVADVVTADHIYLIDTKNGHSVFHHVSRELATAASQGNGVVLPDRSWK